MLTAFDSIVIKSIKLSSIGSSQLDTREYADLVGAEGRVEKEKGTAVEGRRRKEKEEANPTADDWTGLGNVFVGCSPYIL